MVKLTTAIIFILSTLAANASPPEIIDALKQKAESGVAEANYHLGMMYNNGMGVEKSPKKAFVLFTRAAEQGDPLAHYKVGCYYAGQFGTFEGMTPDKDKAFTHKLQAAEAGYSLAQYDIAGIHFRQGNAQESLHWAKRAAEQGNTRALASLFSLYRQPDSATANSSLAYQTLLKIQSLTPPDDNLNKMIEALESKLEASEATRIRQAVSSWKPEPTELTRQAMQGQRRAEIMAGRKSQ